MTKEDDNKQDNQRTILVRVTGGTQKVHVDFIHYITVYKKGAVKIVCYKNNELQKPEKIMTSTLLHEMENKLRPFPEFVRAHDSNIINAHKAVKHLHNKRAGIALMPDGTKLDVSVRNKEYFLKIFNGK